MIKKADQKRMRDYLVAKLENAHPKLRVKKKNILSRIESNYIFTSPDEVVFLVDKEYPQGSLETIYNIFHDNGVEIAPVIFKDGETFFRSAAEKYQFKKKHRLGLKHYSNKDMHNMIFFRPEEIFLKSRKRHLQYYQPESSRLNEGIETFTFENVVFDYSHIPKDKFKPHNRNSKRLYIWKDRFHREGDLRFGEGYLLKGQK